MPRFMVTWLGVFDDEMGAALEAEGIYWQAGIPIEARSKRMHHHLMIATTSVFAGSSAFTRSIEQPPSVEKEKDPPRPA